MTLAGLVLTACFVGCASVVLMAFADVARDTPQGGAVAVRDSRLVLTPIGRPAAPVRYVGRHRR